MSVYTLAVFCAEYPNLERLAADTGACGFIVAPDQISTSLESKAITRIYAIRPFAFWLTYFLGITVGASDATRSMKQVRETNTPGSRPALYGSLHHFKREGSHRATLGTYVTSNTTPKPNIKKYLFTLNTSSIFSSPITHARSMVGPTGGV